MKKVLFIAGGWEGHEPMACCEVVGAGLEKAGCSVEIAESVAVLSDKEKLGPLDLIVPCVTMGEIEKEQREALSAAVESGCGFGGWHGGMGDAFRGDPGFQFMAGGQFVSHPGEGEMAYRVSVKDPFHPIMDGVDSFDFVSEQYYMHVDPSNNVLATTVFDGSVHSWIEGTVMPVVWTRPYGRGRVFYSALGHRAAEFEHPMVWKIAINGLLWAMGDREKR